MTADEAPRCGRRHRQGQGPGIRHQRGAPGPDVRLPARRQGQLRGRPGGHRRAAQDLPGRGHSPPGPTGPSSAAPSATSPRRPGYGSSSTSAPASRRRATPTRSPRRSRRRRRVVYVDYDPIVLAHARALLISHEAGATEYIDADLRDTAAILDQAAQLLDFGKPVAVTLIAILHAIPDVRRPARKSRQADGRRAARQPPRHLPHGDGSPRQQDATTASRTTLAGRCSSGSRPAAARR